MQQFAEFKPDFVTTKFSKQKQQNQLKKVGVTSLGLVASIAGVTAITNQVTSHDQQEKIAKPKVVQEVKQEKAQVVSPSKEQAQQVQQKPQVAPLQAEAVKISDAIKQKETTIEPYIQRSKSLEKVEIRTKEEASLLKSTPMFYANEKLPYEAILNGKANVDTKLREFLLPKIQKYTKEFGIEGTEELLLALTQQESGAADDLLNSDPMQSSQSKNEIVGSISTPEESVRQGVKHFSDMVKQNEGGDVRLTIQAYNFGSGLLKQAKKEGADYSVKFVQEFSKGKMDAGWKPTSACTWRGEYCYGDYTYAAKVLKNFEPNTEWGQKIAHTIQEQNIAIGEPQAEVKEQPKEEVKEQPKEEKSDKAKGVTVFGLNKTNLLEGKVIMLDAGHGGKDSGAVGPDGTKEKDITFGHVMKIKEALESQGATVDLRREGDTFLDVDGIAALTNSKQVDVSNSLFISIHANSAENKAADGIETFYNAEKNQVENNKKLATLIQNKIVDNYETKDRGIRDGRDLAVLRTNKYPSVLVELGFISNLKDLDYMKNEEIEEAVAVDITKAAIEYFGKDYDKEVAKKK